MKKGILTSLVCFTSLIFSSCGSKYVKVTILECVHCSFDNVNQARVGQDFVIQAYLDRGYELDDASDSLDIYAGSTHLFKPCYTFDKENNNLTIDKKYIQFGDITIKGTGDAKQNNLKYVINSGTYDQTLSGTIVSVEGGDYTQVITTGGVAINPNIIHISPEDISYTYNERESKEIKILEKDCYTDITITLG